MLKILIGIAIIGAVLFIAKILSGLFEENNGCPTCINGECQCTKEEKKEEDKGCGPSCGCGK